MQAEWDIAEFEWAKLNKCAEINAACEAAIIGGFVSLALGSPHTYDSNRDDQTNLIGAHLAGVARPYPCTDASGAKVVLQHTASQITQVFNDGVLFKEAHLTKAATLKAQLDAATTVADVQEVMW